MRRFKNVKGESGFSACRERSKKRDRFMCLSNYYGHRITCWGTLQFARLIFKCGNASLPQSARSFYPPSNFENFKQPIQEASSWHQNDACSCSSTCSACKIFTRQRNLHSLLYRALHYEHQPSFQIEVVLVEPHPSRIAEYNALSQVSRPQDASSDPIR